MKQPKAILSVFLTIVMVLSVFTGISVPATAETEGVLTYAINNGEARIYDCDKNASGELIIPDTLDGCPVTCIDDYAFYDCIQLTNITIPDSVISIGMGAFSNTGYYNDESNWEDDVLYIGNHLIEARDTLCGSYTIKVGTKCIARFAFFDCSLLTNITIPDSVIDIGDRAFENCTSLTSIIIPNHISRIDEATFSGCSKLMSVTLPDSLTSIGGWAFENCNSLTSITIPDSMLEIEWEAFSGCSSLISIRISDSVTHIGYDAFSGCTSLTSIIIPDSVTSIGHRAFYDTGYYNDESNWEDGVLYIGNHCISAKDTISGSYTIKDGAICIAGEAFYNCSSLTSITIPDSVTSIGLDAFNECTSLTSITIPDSVTSIGDYAIGYFFNDSTWGYETIEGFIIYGTPGTAAETYANENGITFVAVGEEPSTEEPSTEEPTSEYPGLEEPTSEEPTSGEPISEEPSTIEPATEEPTTAEVTTEEPTTAEVTTEEPTTEAPTTTAPTTTEPTTKAPVTEPTTKAPVTTTEPTTKAPTTTAPTTTTEPTTQTSSELIIKDADTIAVAEDEKIASIGAVDNKGLTVEAIKAKLGNESVAFVNKAGEALAADALVGTGCIVRVLDKDDKVVSEYTVLVPMDVNGDAAITAQDARAALRAAAQLESLDDIYLRAAKTDADKALSAADARRILRKAAHLE